MIKMGTRRGTATEVCSETGNIMRIRSISGAPFIVSQEICRLASEILGFTVECKCFEECAGEYWVNVIGKKSK